MPLAAEAHAARGELERAAELADAFAACNTTDGAVSLRGYSAGSHDHYEPPALPMR